MQAVLLWKDMAQVADVTGSAFLRGYVASQIDAANLRALIRTLRMGKNADFLAGVLFDGGEIGSIMRTMKEYLESPVLFLAQ